MSSLESSVNKDLASLGIIKAYFLAFIIGIVSLSFICSGILSFKSSTKDDKDKTQNYKTGYSSLLIGIGVFFIIYALIHVYYLKQNKIAAANSGLVSLTNSLGSLINSKII